MLTNKIKVFIYHLQIFNIKIIKIDLHKKFYENTRTIPIIHH